MNFSIKSFLLISLLLFGASYLSAQQESGRIKGTVTDVTTGEIMFGANITVKSTSLGSTSDVDGKYLINAIPAGSYTLKVSYIGYRSKEVPVEVKAGATLEMNFSLVSQALEGEEVIVTAQARGQKASINQQLTSNTITNIVSSERIHELPDASAAAALSRLPGVSLMNGDQVVIRGVQAKLNQVLLNGIELPSTDMGGIGSNLGFNPSTRATNLGFISSNLLSSIEVIKAITPDMDANTLGGVVNLRLREAPTGLHFDVLAQGNYNASYHLSDNYKFWASVSQRFFDDKLGVFIQGNMDRSDGGNQQANITVALASQGSVYLDRWGQAVYRTTQATFELDEDIDKNSGGSLILDYKLPNGKIVLQNTYAGNISDHNHNQLNLGFDGNTLNITADRNLYGKELWINALQTENSFGSVKVDATLSHSYTQQYTTLAHGVNPVTEFSSTSPAPFPSVIGQDNISLSDACGIFDNINPSNPQNATGGAGQWVSTQYQSFSQHLYNAAFDVSVPVTFSNDISATFKTGGKYIRTTRENNSDEYRAKTSSDIYANPDANSYFPGVTLSPSRLLRFTDVQNTDFKKGQYFLNNFYDFKNGGFRWAIDESKYDGWLKLSRLGWSNAFEAADSWQNDWNGAEQFSAGYLMGTFNVGQKLMVLGGARFESYNMNYHAQFTDVMHTVMGNAISTANGSVGDTVNPVNLSHNVPYNTHNVDRTDNNVFPGVQAQYKINDWSDMRFAYTTGISRPNYTDIIPKVEFEDGNFNIGNPMLKPSTAQNYDIMGTIHDNTLGLFSVGFFYKEIKNSTYYSTIYFKDVNRYSDVWLPDSAFMADRFGFTIPNTQNVLLPLNNNHLGFIRGIEIDWQTNFWYLPRPFSALVFNVNYTKSASKTDYTIIQNIVTTTTVINPITGRPQQVSQTTATDTTFEGRLLQQANDVVNVALGIDYKGFSGRISFRMTGDVITSVGSRPEEAQYTGNIYGWDFSLKQNLPIEGLSIALNGMNIFHNGINYYRKYRLTPGAPITENLVQVLYSPTLFELNLRYSL